MNGFKVHRGIRKEESETDSISFPLRFKSNHGMQIMKHI